MSSTAIQLYTLREIDHPLPVLLERIGETTIDGVEFAHRFDESDTAAVNRVLERTGLAAVGAHVDIERLETDLEGVIEAYSAVGCDTFVVPWLDPEAFTADTIEETATRLSALAQDVDAAGASLHYHNHDHELRELGTSTGLELLIEQTDEALGFEFDIGWIEAGGGDPVELLERYGDRCDLLHVTDCDSETRTPVEVGTGDVAIQECLTAADRSVHVYEHDEPVNPLQSLETGAAILNR